MFQVSEVLKKVPFFRTLGKDGIDYIVERLKFKPFDSNELICRIGDPGDKMYIIISGGAKVVVKAEESESETIIAHLSSGDYFGEMSLLTGEPRSASVITTESSEMFILNKADFDAMVERFPSISLSLGKIMSQRLRDTLQKAAKTKEGPVSSKIEGKLAEKSLVEILKFCESNSLNGKIIVESDTDRGLIYYAKGELQKVELNKLKDDEALDTMLNWSSGKFVIEPDPLRFDLEKPQPKTRLVDKKIQLIIINNSLVIQRMLQRTFENIGYSVYSTDSKEKGLNLIEKLNPDVIIADTKLIDSDGVDLVNSIRESQIIPIVLLTDKENKAKFSERLQNVENIKYTNNQEIGEILHTVQQFLGR
jgi:CRP-like cAMP-binding protein/CheY-like chemotaxis protein